MLVENMLVIVLSTNGYTNLCRLLNECLLYDTIKHTYKILIKNSKWGN